MLTKEFVDIVSNHSDVPRNFQLAGAYSIISQTIGRYYELYDFSNLKPNTYIIVASAPRFTRRGELLKCVKKVTNTAFEVYNSETNNAEYEKKSNMLEGGSVEGLTDDVNYFKEKGVNSFCLCSSEFGRILTGIKRDKSYMTGMDSLLCKLYSGEPFYQSFSKRRTGEYKPRYLAPGTYFNIFGTMQKPKYYFDNKMSQTGLVRRLSLFSVEGHEVLDNYRAPLGRDTDILYKKLKYLGEKIGSKMLELEEQLQDDSLISITYNDEVKNKFNEYDEQVTRMAKINDENAYYLYKQGQFDQMLKFSMLRAISDNRKELTLEDFNLAKTHVEIATRDLQNILEGTMIPKEQKQYEDNLKRLSHYMKQGLRKREIQQRMISYGVHANMLKELYATLQHDGIIKINEDGEYELL